MSTRETSIEAYREITENGLISKKRLEVYQVVFHYGPMTSGEAYRELGGKYSDGALTQSRARFTELRNMGLFKECGTRHCNVTGKVCIVWDVTSRKKPLEIKKPKKIRCHRCEGRGYFEIEKKAL